MALYMGIGLGFVVLIILWIISILLFTFLSRGSAGLTALGVAIVVMTAILTIILWFIPREDGSDSSDDDVIYDTYIIPRILLVTTCGVFLLVGSVMYGLQQFDIVRAAPLNKLRTA